MKKKNDKFAKKKETHLKPRQYKIRERIKELCSGEGLHTSALLKQLKGINKKDCEEAVNSLMAEKQIQMFVDPQNRKDKVFVTLTEEQGERYKGIGGNEIIILRLIESASDRGLWLKKIKQRTKIPHSDITKILKSLLKKKLIKEVRTKKGRNRKVYMGYDIKPSTDMFGGIWYLKTDLNVELIRGIQTFVLDRVKRMTSLVLSDSLRELKEKNLQNPVIQELGEKEMQQVFDTLVMDGFLEEVRINGMMKYVASNNHVDIEKDNAFTDIPCSTCPVFQYCTENGNISGKTCKYLQEWHSY